MGTARTATQNDNDEIRVIVGEFNAVAESGFLGERH
jgi:hypothetical protein